MDLDHADRVVQTLWDVDARAWQEHWMPIFRRFARDLVLQSKIQLGQVVLDVGTGTGVAAMEAARRLGRAGLVLGIDRSGRMLAIAEKNRRNSDTRNLVFFRMNAEHMNLPDEMFDSVISNCGISYPTFPRVVAEVFRVLRREGRFTFNDWHLIDVPAHKTFSEILRQYRTENPSRELIVLRKALAMSEHVGNRYAHSRELEAELRRAGFKQTKQRQQKYRIKLRGIQEYLALRLQRAAIKQELQELSRTKRESFLRALNEGLKTFVHDGEFVIDWKIAFASAKKPS